MAILSVRDALVAIAKAASSQIPMVGAFVSELGGAIDQRGSLDALDARMRELEKLLDPQKEKAEPPVRVMDIGRSRYARDYLDSVRSITRDPERMGGFVDDIVAGKSIDFFVFSVGVQIVCLHTLLEFYNGSNAFDQDLKALDSLTVLSAQVLEQARPQDDLFAYMSVIVGGEERRIGHLARSWSYLGGLLFKGRRLPEALSAYLTALNYQHVDDTRATRLNIGNCFRSMGLEAYAGKVYRQTLQLYPGSLQVLNRIAEFSADIGEATAAAHYYSKFCKIFEQGVKDGVQYPNETHRNYQTALEFLGRTAHDDLARLRSYHVSYRP